MEKGKIIQVSGPVIDVLFEKGKYHLRFSHRHQQRRICRGL